MLTDYKTQNKLRMQYEVQNAELRGELDFLKEQIKETTIKHEKLQKLMSLNKRLSTHENRERSTSQTNLLDTDRITGLQDRSF